MVSGLKKNLYMPKKSAVCREVIWKKKLVAWKISIDPGGGAVGLKKVRKERFSKKNRKFNTLGW